MNRPETFDAVRLATALHTLVYEYGLITEGKASELCGLRTQSEFRDMMNDFQREFDLERQAQDFAALAQAKIDRHFVATQAKRDKK